MSTKYRIGEQIVKALGQRGVGNISIQQAMLVASQIANANIRDYIWATRADGEITVPHSVLKEFVWPVSYDETRGKYYLSMTVRALDTLYGNMGIYTVYPKGKPEDSLIPLQSSYSFMFSGLDAHSLEGMDGYIPERDRIYLTGTGWQEGDEMSALIIPDCTSLQPDEEVPGFVEKEVDVITQAMQVLAPQLQMLNLENDGTPK